MHGFIFGDLYEWAGKERRSDIFKNEQVLGGLSVTYTFPTEIAREARRAIAALHETDWAGLDTPERAEGFAKAVSALWQIHPFREGNTRAIITFACEFSDRYGFHMDRQLFGAHADFTRKALVMASIGKYSEYEHITRIFADSMERGEQAMNMMNKQDPKA
jgi:cell filamentation protein